MSNSRSTLTMHCWILTVFLVLFTTAIASAEDKQKDQTNTQAVTAVQSAAGSVSVSDKVLTVLKTTTLPTMETQNHPSKDELAPVHTKTAEKLPATGGSAPPTLTNEALYPQSFRALFVLFVIATILESGLAVLFNWRPFIQLFDARGIRTVISVLFAWFFVSTFDLDIVTRLINVYSDNKDFKVAFPGLFITALVIAGGSSGVNSLLIALGFRSVKTAEQITPRPPADKAWIAVRLIREKAHGSVLASIGDPAAAPGGALTVAGTISGKSRQGWIARFFFRDYGRFPTAGGFAVRPGQPCTVSITGTDENHAVVGPVAWGPYALAAGAIVDIELRL